MQVCATTYEIRLTLRSKIHVNEPVIAKCVTRNNSLVLVTFTNDITLYSNTTHKRHIPIYSQKNRAKHARFYASGRSPIYLNININKNYRLFDPPK